MKRKTLTTRRDEQVKEIKAQIAVSSSKTKMMNRFDQILDVKITIITMLIPGHPIRMIIQKNVAEIVWKS